MDGYKDGWIGHVMGNWNQKAKQLCFGFYTSGVLPTMYMCVIQKCFSGL